MDEDDALRAGLFEAIENAVDYFKGRGLDDYDVLRVLSMYYKAHKEGMMNVAITGAVDDFLEDIFGDGRGTE